MQTPCTRANPFVTVCTTASPAATPFAAIPMATSAIPSVAALATVIANAVTRPLCCSIHCVNTFITSVTLLIRGCNVPFIASAMAFIAPSTADISSRNEPPSPASIFWAVSAATPSTSINLAIIASSSSVFAVKVRPASEPRMSKISSAKASFSAVGIVCMTLAMSRIISAILRRLPFASTVSTPTARSCSWTLTLLN